MGKPQGQVDLLSKTNPFLAHFPLPTGRCVGTQSHRKAMRYPHREQERGGIPAKSQKHVSESAGDARQGL